MSSLVPDGWSELRVRDLFTLNTKSVMPNNFPQEKFTYFSLPAYDKFGTSIEVYGSEIESNKFEINDTSVLVSKLNPRKPRVMYAKPEKLRACASTEFMSFVPIESNGVSLNFFTHYFFSELFQKRLELVATGSTNSHVRVSPKETTNWRIAVPTLLEQKKIASILTSVDEVIENTQKQIDKLQDLKKATMNELMTKGIGHTEFKDSELGRIPKSWEVVSLEKNLETMTDYVANGSFEALRNNVVVYDHLEFALYVRLFDLRLGLGHKSQKYIDENSFRFLNKSELHEGDLLIANIGANVGEVFLMPKTSGPASIAPNMILMRCGKGTNAQFLFHFLRSTTGRKSISFAISGSGQPKMNKTDLKRIYSVLPSYKEQTKIASIVSSIDERIERQGGKLRHLDSLKKSLMQDLLTGKVRVTVS